MTRQRNSTSRTIARYWSYALRTGVYHLRCIYRGDSFYSTKTGRPIRGSRLQLFQAKSACATRVLSLPGPNARISGRKFVSESMPESPTGLLGYPCRKGIPPFRQAHPRPAVFKALIQSARSNRHRNSSSRRGHRSGRCSFRRVRQNDRPRLPIPAAPHRVWRSAR